MKATKLRFAFPLLVTDQSKSISPLMLEFEDFLVSGSIISSRHSYKPLNDALISSIFLAGMYCIICLRKNIVLKPCAIL